MKIVAIEVDPEVLGKLSPQAVKLYLVLHTQADDLGKVKNISRAKLAELMGIKHSKSISKYMRELELTGALGLTHYMTPGGGFGPNTYWLRELRQHENMDALLSIVETKK